MGVGAAVVAILGPTVVAAVAAEVNEDARVKIAGAGAIRKGGATDTAEDAVLEIVGLDLEAILV